MRIGELARAAGVVISTARFFERHGVFAASARSRDGAIYGAGALARLRFALRVRACGLDMKAVTAAVHAFDAQAPRRDALLEPVLADIRARESQLAHVRQVLEVGAAGRATLSDITALLDG